MTANDTTVTVLDRPTHYTLRCLHCGLSRRVDKPCVLGVERAEFEKWHRHQREALPAPTPAILDTLRTELLIRRGALDRSLNGPVALPAAIAAIEWCKLDAIKAALEWVEAAERVVRDDSE